MRKNIVASLLAAVVLGLVIGLAFAFDNTALTNCGTVFTFYLISKILFGLVFVGVVAYGIIENKARGTFYPMVILMLVLQFIPMLMRTYVALPKFQLGACLITLCVCLAAMVVVIGILPGVSQNHVNADEKYAAEEIEVLKNLPDKF